jgi:KDO2-lipid IV(A) lauroyltransferase
MNKDSIIDYSGCILIRLFGPLIRSLPLNVSLFLGARLGELFYYFDLKHKAIAYANIKTAFGTSTSLSANGECNRTIGAKLSPQELSNLVKQFYRSFGQSLIEILFIPLVDKTYIDKYITMEGQQHIFEGFKKGKGVILVTVHAGSWEFSNIICANLGFAFNLFIRNQRYPRLNELLNAYRSRKGCKLIQREDGTRQLIRALQSNQAIGMTADQGGKTGTSVKFFGKYASMPSGVIRLALKYDAAIIPAFYTRVNGPYIKVFIDPPIEIKRTGNLEKDINDNLQAVVRVFEKYISKYPREYLWSYKIWKYTKEQNILIISDGKTGHLRQSEAIAEILKGCLKDKGISANINTIEIKFKNRFSRFGLTFSSCLAGKYHCQGCLWCLRTFLKDDVYRALISIKPDIVITCGASVAPINYIISRENLAKSIVIMRPSVLNTKRFNLVVMSRHDRPPRRRRGDSQSHRPEGRGLASDRTEGHGLPSVRQSHSQSHRPEGRGLASDSQSHRPPRRKNVTVIEGALNLINEDYLKGQGERIKSHLKINKELVLGVLVGGDTKVFHLSKDLMQEIARQIKLSLEKLDAELLITTSRRTSGVVESLLKEEFLNYHCCKLLIIANEKNIPEAVGGILASSEIIITSPESISMISEAVNSSKYVLVFNSPNLSKKHRRFLNYFAKNKYIYLVNAYDLAGKIEEIWLNRPKIHTLRDNFLVTEAIKKIL